MRRTAGFTLLEIVLAMAILAMVTGICYGAFFVASRSVEKGEVAVVAAQRLRVATDVMIRQVKSAVAYPARNEDDEVYPYFKGDASSMAFITANGRLASGGLAWVSYHTAPGQDGTDLVIDEDPYFGPDQLGTDQVDPATVVSTQLLTGLKGVTFQYLLDDGADLEWKDQWDAYEEDTLPAAIRIMVEGMPGLETDVWGQEIPIMVTTYGDANGEVDEDDMASDDLNEPNAEADDDGGDE
jgi:prepilin-type N-terminal cleavage/methylation domain-containing protein